MCRGRGPCCAGVPVFVEEGDAASQGSFSLLSAHPQTLNSLPVSHLLIPLEALAVSTRAALSGLDPFAGVSSVLQAPPLTGSLIAIRGPRNLVRVLSSGLCGCPEPVSPGEAGREGQAFLTSPGLCFVPYRDGTVFRCIPPSPLLKSAPLPPTAIAGLTVKAREGR